MIASRITEEELQAAARSVGLTIEVSTLSGTGLRHRVKVNPGPPPAEALTKGGNRRKGEAGDGAYQRTSASGFNYDRRVAAVCWHGFRDYFRACFELEPDARFSTAMDCWNGTEDFESRFAVSGTRNIGSRIQPVMAAEACRCPDSGYAG